MADAYQEFLVKTREIGQLEAVESLLDWDLETQMPPNGIHNRADQLSLLARLIHDRRTDDDLAALLSMLNGAAGDPALATNIREMKRIYDRAVKVPSELVGRISRVSAVAKAAWVKARDADDFSAFAPHLTELIELKRETADLIGHDGDRYDALLDEYEPGMTTVRVAEVFESLRGPLSDFVRQLADAPNQPDTSILHRHFPVEAQKRFSRRLASAIGFDFESGRLDVSAHPFCSGVTPSDVRMTTRYQEDFFSAATFGTLHEAGHGLYEQGLSQEHAFTPMGEAVSLGVHESQSRMWENFVGRGRPFWEYFYAECQETFPEGFGDVPLDRFHAAVNAVHPTLIRVEADEVTYGLHIILRFELERRLIDGSLAVKDIPDAWNAKMEELLNVTPDCNRNGCLQDIHWSMGAIGYFPTYALGNLYAAQIFDVARRQIPDLEDRFRKGDFRTLLDWLRENVHRHGRRYRAAELIQVITGEPISTKPFMDYLHGKFSPIYGL
jgi:carboxypeptidase Taq